MKRLLLLGFVILTCVAPLHATEIFWDQESPPADPTITDSDFKMKYGSFPPAKSLEKIEVYDSGEVPDLPGWTTEPESPAVTQPVRSRDTLDAPRPAERSREITPPRPAERSRELTPPRPVQRTKRQPAAPADTSVEPSPSRIEPAVAPDEPAPSRINAPDAEPRRGTPVPAVGGEPTQPQPKKLPWGQEDNKPATEQPNTKFQWGQTK